MAVRMRINEHLYQPWCLLNYITLLLLNAYVHCALAVV